MRLIGDEHVSPKIIRALQDLAISRIDGWQIESAVGSRYSGREDEDWVAAFARDGGHGLISADREMLKRPTLITQISETGLIGIYVRGGYANAPRVRQAAHMLFWWPRIEETFRKAAPGTAWIVPNGFGEAKPLRECQPFGKPINKADAGDG